MYVIQIATPIHADAHPDGHMTGADEFANMAFIARLEPTAGY